ncbi:DUF397 domain-containing protein [Streptomyces sp. NPDC059072]|uniref:DUF397 domain-containing protein n=1 Tax=Streptomyces sp. NPDC059072 TaxID=3346715 RepID=UPI00369D0E5D
MTDTTELHWFKSSYSDGSEGDSCVEVAWFKSSYSSSDGNDCIEVAAVPTAVLVRDSKDTRLPHLTIGRHAWTGFVAHASGS